MDNNYLNKKIHVYDKKFGQGHSISHITQFILDVDHQMYSHLKHKFENSHL